MSVRTYNVEVVTRRERDDDNREYEVTRKELTGDVKSVPEVHEVYLRTQTYGREELYKKGETFSSDEVVQLLERQREEMMLVLGRKIESLEERIHKLETVPQNI